MLGKAVIFGELVSWTADSCVLSLRVVVLSIVAVKRVNGLVARRFAKLGGLHALDHSLAVLALGVDENSGLRVREGGS